MSDLLFTHGGYRKLKSFQVARLVYDITVWFVESYVHRFSRTRDQMVQAARSGVQNIAEGSQASATSKKIEIKLTQVARASLEELKLDYEDFLRQRGLPLLEPQHPSLLRFKKRKPRTLAEFQAWLEEERRNNTDKQGQSRTDKEKQRQSRTGMGHHGPTRIGTEKQRKSRTDTEKQKKTWTDTDAPGRALKSGNQNNKSVFVGDCPCGSLEAACLAANAALSLLNLACWFLDRQVKSQAIEFENRGGFTERMYRKRRNQKKKE